MATVFAFHTGKPVVDISRKTGYERESKLGKSDEHLLLLQREHDELKGKHAGLAVLYEDVHFEND